MSRVFIDGVEYIPRPQVIESGLSAASFGEFIKGCRKSMGITLAEASERIGCSSVWLSTMENSHVDISLRLAIKLCKAYSLKLGMLEPYFDED